MRIKSCLSALLVRNLIRKRVRIRKTEVRCSHKFETKTLQARWLSCSPAAQKVVPRYHTIQSKTIYWRTWFSRTRRTCRTTRASLCRSWTRKTNSWSRSPEAASPTSRCKSLAAKRSVPSRMFKCRANKLNRRDSRTHQARQRSHKTIPRAVKALPRTNNKTAPITHSWARGTILGRPRHPSRTLEEQARGRSRRARSTSRSCSLLRRQRPARSLRQRPRLSVPRLTKCRALCKISRS